VSELVKMHCDRRQHGLAIDGASSGAGATVTVRLELVQIPELIVVNGIPGTRLKADYGPDRFSVCVERRQQFGTQRLRFAIVILEVPRMANAADERLGGAS
jgi:hypothetical protein